MTYRVIWTRPVVPNMEPELADSLEWESRDMAQLAALMRPSQHVGRYRDFRVEATQGTLTLKGARRG